MNTASARTFAFSSPAPSAMSSAPATAWHSRGCSPGWQPALASGRRMSASGRRIHAARRLLLAARPAVCEQGAVTVRFWTRSRHCVSDRQMRVLGGKVPQEVWFAVGETSAGER
jgi:hypothetical protein